MEQFGPNGSLAPVVFRGPGEEDRFQQVITRTDWQTDQKSIRSSLVIDPLAIRHPPHIGGRPTSQSAPPEVRRLIRQTGERNATTSGRL